MNFANPNILWGLLFLPLAMLFLYWAERNRQNAIRKLGQPGLIDRLSFSVNWRGRRWQSRLWLLALTLIIITLARPQWGTEVQMIEQEGLQVMVALDVSQSMLAQDIKPDRLTRAKLEINDLMHKMNGDQVGLVLFSGASFLQFPLTSDYDTAGIFLNNASPAAISRPGTEIGDAIRTAMSGFNEQQSSQKVLVIVTDGENHQPDAISEAEKAAADGVLIYTIGFGSSEGEPIPEFASDGTFLHYKTDKDGQTVLTYLDEATLQAIAQTGNGRYYRAAADGSEMDALIADLASLQRAQLDSRFESTPIERYQIFLTAAVLVLILSELIPSQVKPHEQKLRKDSIGSTVPTNQ